MIYVSILTMIFPVLLGVSFQTPAERQLMALMQRRVGLQVSGFGGILQPFWDGMKLGVKEPLLPELSASGTFSWKWFTADRDRKNETVTKPASQHTNTNTHRVSVRQHERLGVLALTQLGHHHLARARMCVCACVCAPGRGG